MLGTWQRLGEAMRGQNAFNHGVECPTCQT